MIYSLRRTLNFLFPTTIARADDNYAVPEPRGPIATHGRTGGVPTKEDGVSRIHGRECRQHVNVILSNYIRISLWIMYFNHVRKVSSQISLTRLYRLFRDEHFCVHGNLLRLYEKYNKSGKSCPWLACADCTAPLSKTKIILNLRILTQLYQMA